MADCLATLRLHHTWYDTHPGADLALVPDPRTAALLRRFGLWGRYANGEWTLHAAQSGDAQSLLAGLGRALEGAPLCLRLAGDLAHLAAVTALPDGLCTLPGYSSRAFETVGNGDGVDHVLTAQTGGSGPLAAVWLFPDDLGRAAPGTTWTIRFEAVALPWTYYLVNRSGAALNQPIMRASDGRVLSGPTPALLPDGDRALRFDTGGQKLPFSRSPSLRLGLFDQFHSPLSDRMTEICLVRSLPLPTPKSLLQEGEGAQRQISAATVVYL